MSDPGDGTESTVRHRRCHRRKIRRGDPAILPPPKHQVGMPDLRHPPLQLAALPLQIQVERRTEPDALGNTECLFQYAFVENLDLAEALPKPRHHIWRVTLRNE